MRILISNDDGWDAPGIAALLDVANSFGKCTVVAPADEQSGVSHQLTLWRSIELIQRSENVWSLDGTPADCVRVGLTQLDNSFDLVLSGINNGGNLGSDVYVSGTVAAAREATLFGLPAIAISQHRLRFGEAYDWTRTKLLCQQALEHCFQAGLKKRELLNINLPDFLESDRVADIEIVDPCPLDPEPRLARYESETADGKTVLKSVGKYNDRKRTPGCDLATCFAKQISITRMQF